LSRRDSPAWRQGECVVVGLNTSMRAVAVASFALDAASCCSSAVTRRVRRSMGTDDTVAVAALGVATKGDRSGYVLPLGRARGISGERERRGGGGGGGGDRDHERPARAGGLLPARTGGLLTHAPRRFA